VAQAVVVADERVLVVRRRIPHLRRQKARPVDPFLAVGDQRPASARGDDLVAVEGEDRQVPEDPRRPALVRRPEGRYGGCWPSWSASPPTVPRTSSTLAGASGRSTRRWGWVHEGRACFSSRARRGESRSLALPGPPSESRQAGLYAPGSGYPWTPGWQGSWGG